MGLFKPKEGGPFKKVGEADLRGFSNDGPIGEMTEEEYDAVLLEVAERAVDIFNEKYIKQKRRLLDKQFLEGISGKDRITIEYDLEFVGNDVIQILGRLRRKMEDLM